MLKLVSSSPLKRIYYFCYPAELFLPSTTYLHRRTFTTSSLLYKIGKGKKKDKLQPKNAMDVSALKGNSRDSKKFLDEDDIDEEDDEEEGRSAAEKSKIGVSELAIRAVDEMKDCYETLVTNIDKHMTLSVNLKNYEDVNVTLENGQTHKMNKLARIKMRSNNTIALNFTDHPETIKQARLALQAFGDLNVQQDGIVLYVPVPKITRERREELAKKVSAAILSEYKMALTQVYSKYNNKIANATKVKDAVIRLNNGLLNEKRKYDVLGEERIKERRKVLLTEVL